MTLYYNLREGREVAVKLHNLNSETQVEEGWFGEILSNPTNNINIIQTKSIIIKYHMNQSIYLSYDHPLS